MSAMGGRWLLFVGALASVATGCHRAATPFRLTERRMQHLLEVASRETSCPAVGMTYEQISERVFRVSGCGTYVDFGGFMRGRGRYVSARWRPIAPITERAPLDMQCPRAASTFTPTGPMAYTVAGCGRVAQFELRCGDVDCGWIQVGASAAPVVAASSSSVVVAPVSPGAPVEETLQAARASVLACSSGAAVSMRVAWDGTGHVTLALDPPLGGTPVETCVAGVVGSALTRPPTVPGSATVVVR